MLVRKNKNKFWGKIWSAQDNCYTACCPLKCRMNVLTLSDKNIAIVFYNFGFLALKGQQAENSHHLAEKLTTVIVSAANSINTQLSQLRDIFMSCYSMYIVCLRYNNLNTFEFPTDLPKAISIISFVNFLHEKHRKST